MITTHAEGKGRKDPAKFDSGLLDADSTDTTMATHPYRTPAYAWLWSP